MDRIMIIGQPGSGKSTLARALSRRTGLPVVHIDHIHWQPGWVERSRDEKTRLCRAAASEPRWIFEGGHSVTWAERAARADMIVWLDLPVGLRLARVLWRTVRWMGQSRPDLPPGCPEGFHRETLPFWAFIWRTRKTSRQGILRLRANLPPNKPFVHLRRAAEVREFLARWPAEKGT